MPVDPFSLDLPSSLIGRATAYVARPLLSRLIGVDELRAIYTALPAGPDETFADRVLAALAVDVVAAPGDLLAVPAQGPLIVAANHPRGALDGLVLAALLRRVRPDARLLANYMLSRIPELRSSCFFVDPFEGPAADAQSLAGLRAALVWLRRGGALIMFPAGEVAHWHGDDGARQERHWAKTLGRLASRTHATIVPAFIDGANSRLFYAAGRVHPMLRTALLPRELLRSRQQRVNVRFGRPLPPDGDSVEATARAREAVRHLSVPQATPPAEVRRLPREAVLVRSGRFEVFCAPAADIPATLQEIGRLRAVSYRAAGEGTGADVDLDEFDHHYLHLFAWDHERDRVVGAYRIGRTDLIVNDRGVSGLYTRTLFRYGRDLLDTLAPALELGRSFVRPEYQRHYQSLLLLWRGIGRFVVLHPQYRVLFGPVSISGTYSDASQTLLTRFLEQNHLDASLARMVTPLHPRPATTRPGECVVPAAVHDIDRQVARLEADGKGMPVLLRQYLRLKAMALGFSVDPEFGHVVDALMAIDLTRVDDTILRRYLGDEGVVRFREHRAGMPALSSAA